MMANSQTGYPMLGDYGDPALARNPLVPGSSARLYGGMRGGDALTVMLYYAARFNDEVEGLDDGPINDWGFDPNHNNTTSTSDHKSGTAMDLNSTKHPHRVRGTFSLAQYARMRQIAEDIPGVYRLGIDWSGNSVDEMHVSLAKLIYGTGRVEAAAAAIREGRVPMVHPDLRTNIIKPPVTPTVPTTPEENDMTPEQLKAITDRLDAIEDVQTKALANARDTRMFAEQIRGNVSRIASGEIQVRTR